MAEKDTTSLNLQFFPVTPERHADFETLFGAKGACSGCWCMYWRVRNKTFRAGIGEGNRQAIRQIIEAGQEPGLLAYEGSEPVGWVCVGPREQFAALEHSRVLARIDDRPVWSITCFFVTRRVRGQGIMRRLIDAAVEYAAAHGAKTIEAYPMDHDQKVEAPNAFMGEVSPFRAAGFTEVARRSERHPMMRKEIS